MVNLLYQILEMIGVLRQSMVKYRENDLVPVYMQIGAKQMVTGEIQRQMDTILKVDRAIKNIWLNQIPRDYNQHYLLEEDSLKCALYFHLRSELGDGWLNRYRIRIYSELHLNNQKRADIAIVKLKPKNEREGCFLRDCIEEVLAIIELKFKGSSANSQVFYNDVYKLKEYAKSYPDVQLYAGFIQESLYNDSNCSWFDGRQTSKWAKGRVTELLGYWDEKDEEFTVKVNAYNNLNLDII